MQQTGLGYKEIEGGHGMERVEVARARKAKSEKEKAARMSRLVNRNFDSGIKPNEQVCAVESTAQLVCKETEGAGTRDEASGEWGGLGGDKSPI